MANFQSIVKELQQERDRLDRAIAALTSLNGTAVKTRQRRTLSAAARARIAAAQRARWAKHRNTARKAVGRPKRRISSAGIARIRAAAKARWAKIRAAKKK
jgi:exonuclease VII small subunit